MITKGKSIIGLHIVTVDTGSIVQTVTDLLYNPKTHQVEALLVTNGGLFSSAKAVAMSDVKNIGENAVIIPDSSVVKSVKEIGGSIQTIANSDKYLVKTNVLTIDGKELGKVTDIYFDSQTGYVETMEVSQGGLKTITEGKKSIKPSDIVTIGADATIVSNYTEAKLEEQGEENGLKGALNDAKDKASDVSNDIKEQAESTAKGVRRRSAKLQDNTRRKMAEANDFVEDKVTEAKNTIDEKSNDATLHAKRMMEKTNVKDQDRSKITTANNKSNKVVEQTKKKYEDAKKKVKIEKTKSTK